MAQTTDDTARHLGKLAALIRQRRVTLGYTKAGAAEACGIAPMTYNKVEGTRGVAPQRVDAGTYTKVEVAFQIRARACLAVAEGEADSITLEDGTELIEGGQITQHQVDVAGLTEEMRREFIDVATVTSPGIPLGEADAMSREAVERAVKILRERGILPNGE
ncbi:hypothetical protein [Streptomyces sp. bgisy034]|uniref:hypothetical protein n=1 Tax=Streptomyces sp. bgisy034 TaxID=3413774 RepID=UPI003EB8D609